MENSTTYHDIDLNYLLLLHKFVVCGVGELLCSRVKTDCWRIVCFENVAIKKDGRLQFQKKKGMII